MVNTVLGPVPAEKLGFTLTHEHITLSTIGWEVDTTVSKDRRPIVKKALEQVKPLKALGISTIVDCSTPDLGRDVDTLKAVSEASGINIIATSGFYMELRGIPLHFRRRSLDQVAEHFVNEIEKGIAGTDVKAGIIKCATGHGKVTELEEMVFRAAARAAKATGVPITTHTTEGTMGKEQLDIFQAEGMDLSHVIIGHCCESADVMYHRSLMDRGANIGFDRISIENRIPDAVRATSLIGLIGAGYADRLVLSHDIVCCMKDGHRIMLPPHELEQFLGRNLDILCKKFIPMLKKGGVSDASVRQMTTSNVARIFSGKSGRKRR